MRAQKIKSFGDHHLLVGPVLWIASLQFFIVQWFVAAAWARPYSLSQNTISDLGNSACGAYGSRYVCSPHYSWMNASFIILGITMAIGAMLIYHQLQKTRVSAVGFGLLVLAGIGTIMVGIFPENNTGNFHLVGAVLSILIGDIGVLLLGLSLKMPQPMRLYTIITGCVAILAFGLFACQTYFGLGIGGMERLAANLQTLWLIIFGAYLVKKHPKAGV